MPAAPHYNLPIKFGAKIRTLLQFCQPYLRKLLLSHCIWKFEGELL